MKRTLSLPPQVFSCYKHLSHAYLSAWRQQTISVFLARHNIFSNPVLALLKLPKWVKLEVLKWNVFSVEKKKKTKNCQEIALKRIVQKFRQRVLI